MPPDYTQAIMTYNWIATLISQKVYLKWHNREIDTKHSSMLRAILPHGLALSITATDCTHTHYMAIFAAETFTAIYTPRQGGKGHSIGMYTELLHVGKEYKSGQSFAKRAPGVNFLQASQRYRCAKNISMGKSRQMYKEWSQTVQPCMHS